MNRGSRFPRAAALAAALFVSVGCATKGDLRRVQVEMAVLAERQDSLMVLLAREAASTQDTLRGQNDQLLEIRGDVSRRLQRILDELVTIRELTGQNQRTIARVRDQLEGLRRGGVSSPPGSGAGAQAAGPGQLGGAVAASGLAEQVYNTAVQLHERGSLGTAQQAFEDFLGRYGAHVLAPRSPLLSRRHLRAAGPVAGRDRDIRPDPGAPPYGCACTRFPVPDRAAALGAREPAGGCSLP